MPAAFPPTTSRVPPQVPPIVAAALRSVRAIEEWPEHERAERLRHVFEGCQYDERRYDWDGFVAGSGGAARVAAANPPPVDQRRPSSRYHLGRLIVRRLTGMVVGEAGFPEVFCETDADAEAFARATAKAASASLRLKEARNDGGATGTAVLSFAWVQGRPVIEVHKREQVTVLEWADVGQQIPARVLKLWTVCEPAVDASSGTLVQRETWMAREWSAPIRTPEGSLVDGIDRSLRFLPEDASGPARWDIVAEVPVDECPVVWITNSAAREGLDGESDFEGLEGLLDSTNYAFSSAVGGTVRNADPTLVMHLNAENNRGAPIRKGGYNVLWSENGASYLEVSGSAAAAALSVTDKARAFALECADVTLMDPEKMSGAAQSGEALRRLMFPMVVRASDLRGYWTPGILRLLEGLVGQARRLLAREPRTVFELEPRVTKELVEDDAGVMREQVTSITPQHPGRTGAPLALKWPDFFPDSTQDRLARVQGIQAANGQRPVISLRTGVEAAAPLFGVVDIDQELADIEEGERRMSDAQAVRDVATEQTQVPAEDDDAEDPPDEDPPTDQET